MKTFRDFTPEEIQAARETVAKELEANARAVRAEDPYASHVTEAEKDMYLEREIAHAQKIKTGALDGKFYVAQRLYYALTRESVALLPSY